MSDTEVDLTFVTTEAMWEELRTRYDALLLIGNQPTKGSESEYVYRFIGPRTHILGLAEFAKRRVYTEMLREQGDDEDDNE